MIEFPSFCDPLPRFRMINIYKNDDNNNKE